MCIGKAMLPSAGENRTADRVVMPSSEPPKSEERPSAWVERFAPLIPEAGTVLDLACGRGRHTRYLRGLGFQLVAVDIDISGLADLSSNERVELIEADLESGPWPLEGRLFDGIVVSNYLHRPLLPRLAESLAPRGVLLYETFARGNERFGRPSNPAFLLEPGELLEAFGSRLQVVAYEYGLEDEPRPAVRQRICAVQTFEPVRVDAR